MLERLVISAALFALGLLVYKYLLHHQIGRLMAIRVDEPIFNDLKPGIPSIVYFTTPNCIPCKTRQQPALAELVQFIGDQGVQVVRIDATENPETADRWGVLTAPTTFVLDEKHNVLAINHGIADAGKLRRQLSY